MMLQDRPDFQPISRNAQLAANAKGHLPPPASGSKGCSAADVPEVRRHGGYVAALLGLLAHGRTALTSTTTS